jgi:hypothetical protein
MTPEALTTYIVGCLRVSADIHITEAERLLAEHDGHRRTEVLTEAAAVAERFTEQWPDMDAMKADGIIGPFTAFGRVADELRDMARKDTRDSTQLPAGESTETAPDFFQPGRTYIDGDGFRAPETLTLFRVETVARHPSRGTLRAIGWAKIGAAPGGTWHGYFLDEGESTGWTEYAEGEVLRG